MSSDLALALSWGLILIIVLLVIGSTFWLGVHAIKNRWSLRFVLGVPLSVATFVICIFVWLMLHDIAYLIFGVAFGVANLFSGYLYPSIVIENVNTLLARFARKKT